MLQGLGVLGHRVMETVGRDITDINFSRGFAIELGSTLSVVLASVAGKPTIQMLLTFSEAAAPVRACGSWPYVAAEPVPHCLTAIFVIL